MRRSLPLALRDEKALTNATTTLLAKWAPSGAEAKKTKFMNRPIDVVRQSLCGKISPLELSTIKGFNVDLD
jgi:hypothetical protein